MIETIEWDNYFLNLLPHISKKSKDTTKTSAIIVGPDHAIRSTGYNGMPRGFNDLDLNKWEKPEKYYWVEHAERNAIYNASRMGASTYGCTMYASHFPCVDCARGIVQSGILRVVLMKENLHHFRHQTSKYFEHENKTIEIFNSCGVMFDILPLNVDNEWAV